VGWEMCIRDSSKVKRRVVEHQTKKAFASVNLQRLFYRTL